jgi:AraC-like DNA-binding protein
MAMFPRAAEIKSFRFVPDDLSSRHGMALWREVVGNSILKLDMSPLPGRPFYSDAWNWITPRMRVTHAVKSGMRMERSGRFLTDRNDDVGLHIGDGGIWRIFHRGREAALGRGDAVLVSNAEAAAITCAKPARCICVQFPREALAALVPHVDVMLMRPIPANNEALRLLVGHARALKARGKLMEPELQDLVINQMRDLLAFALGASCEARERRAGSLRAARLAAIKRDIRKRLDTLDDLSVTAVARHHGISPRYVQILFETEGTTFSTYVRGERLGKAYRMLGDARCAHHSISEIAFLSGFGDLSHFNRGFRMRYGATPSDVRAEALLNV